MTGQAVGFPPSAQLRKSLSLPRGDQRTAMLPVHSQIYSQIRKKSCKHASKTGVAKQQPVSHGGQVLAPAQVRSMGNCHPQAPSAPATRPPRSRAGRAKGELRILSWNAGHLGQQQCSEIKSWLKTVASQTCDVLLVLQKKHTGRDSGVHGCRMVLRVGSLSRNRGPS